MQRGWLGAVLACALLFGTQEQAEAGSGYYYGAHFGFWNFLEDKPPFGGSNEVEGGYAFGPKAGIYFISSWFGLGIDLSANFGLVGEDSEFWFLNLPTLSVAAGTGFDAFMLYVGGAIQLFGLDNFNPSDNIVLSMGNPYLFGGLQLGYGGFIARGEFQLGHAFRFADSADYSFTNISITLGYGLYTDFL